MSPYANPNPIPTLTTQGANVNTQTKSQMTALQLTVAINDPALCAESLVKAGADTSLKNEEGYTRRWTTQSKATMWKPFGS